jgi:transposase
MNNADLSECCRKKGLYKEQIDAWRSLCLNENTGEINQIKRLSHQLKEEKRRIFEIEKGLRKKEPALAEAEAVIIIKKKGWSDLGGSMYDFKEATREITPHIWQLC